MKRIFVSLLTLCLLLPCAKAQLLAWGPQAAVVYSYLSLKGPETDLQTTGSSIGYQAGLFLRRDFKTFYLEADVLYTGNVGGTYVYNNNEMDVKASFVNVPILLGKKFFPGIRIFVGPVPYFNLGTNPEINIHDFMQTSGTEGGQGMSMNFQAGAGVDVSKLTLSIRYEACVAGGFYHHSDNNGNYTHRIPMFSLSLVIRLN
jgi:hypothetical protein